jgi:hypothetical protein
MDMADKILAKQSTDLVDESWMERLWQWADDNDIDDEILPRDREGLVNLTELHLEYILLTKLPKELQEWFDNIEEAYIQHNFPLLFKSLPTPCQVVKVVVHP